MWESRVGSEVRVRDGDWRQAACGNRRAPLPRELVTDAAGVSDATLVDKQLATTTTYRTRASDAVAIITASDRRNRHLVQKRSPTIAHHAATGSSILAL